MGLKKTNNVLNIQLESKGGEILGNMFDVLLDHQQQDFEKYLNKKKPYEDMSIKQELFNLLYSYFRAIGKKLAILDAKGNTKQNTLGEMIIKTLCISLQNLPITTQEDLQRIIDRHAKYHYRVEDIEDAIIYKFKDMRFVVSSGFRVDLEENEGSCEFIAEKGLKRIPSEITDKYQELSLATGQQVIDILGRYAELAGTSILKKNSTIDRKNKGEVAKTLETILLTTGISPKSQIFLDSVNLNKVKIIDIKTEEELVDIYGMRTIKDEDFLCKAIFTQEKPKKK